MIGLHFQAPSDRVDNRSKSVFTVIRELDAVAVVIYDGLQLVQLSSSTCDGKLILQASRPEDITLILAAEQDAFGAIPVGTTLDEPRECCCTPVGQAYRHGSVLFPKRHVIAVMPAVAERALIC
jgi:hypothetical protein